MVKKISHKGKTYFMCEACDMYYPSEYLAKQCEDWCNEKKSCNLEIMKHSVQHDVKKEAHDCC